MAVLLIDEDTASPFLTMAADEEKLDHILCRRGGKKTEVMILL
jgi:hypothetical protein